MTNALHTSPALALLEFESIAAGYLTADAMAKRAPVAHIVVGSVQPGRLLVLLGGGVAEVEEAAAAGRQVAASSLLDEVLLTAIHPGVVKALLGRRQPVVDLASAAVSPGKFIHAVVIPQLSPEIAATLQGSSHFFQNLR